MFKGILKLLAIIIMIIAIIAIITAMLINYELIATVMLESGALGIELFGIGFTAASLIGVGVAGIAVAYMISPEGASKVTHRLGNGIKDVATTVGDTVVDTAGSVAKTLLKNPIVLIGLGFVGYNMIKD